MVVGVLVGVFGRADIAIFPGLDDHAFIHTVIKKVGRISG